MARTIEDVPFKLTAINEIASRLAKIDKSSLSKLFKEDLGAARTIYDLHEKSIAISEIALGMAKAGLDKNEICGAFKEALDSEGDYTNKIFRENVDERMRSIFLDDEHNTIKDILSKMVEAGFDNNGIKKSCSELKTDIRFRMGQ